MDQNYILDATASPLTSGLVGLSSHNGGRCAD